MNLNWIKYGWGKQLSDKIIPDEFLYIDLKNNGNIIYIDPLTAAIDAVMNIKSQYPEPYTLMLSGGIDSQGMLWAWLQSGVKFQSKTFTYNSIYNYHDIKTTIDVARKFKYDFNYENFDLFAFLDNEFVDYAYKYECSSPQICAYMKMAETVTDGTVIFSGNFLQTPNISLNYTILGLHRYAMIKRTVVPFFFLHTPELAYAFDPYHKKSLNLKIKPSDIKVNTNNLAGFPVISQDNYRYSGFELVKDYYDYKYYDKVPKINRLKYAKYKSTRTFDVLLRYPLLEKMKYSENTIALTNKI